MVIVGVLVSVAVVAHSHHLSMPDPRSYMHELPRLRRPRRVPPTTDVRPVE